MKPKKRKPGRPKGRTPTRAIQVRAPLEMADALARLAQKTKRTRNQELVIALEKHLRDQGELT